MKHSLRTRGSSRNLSSAAARITRAASVHTESISTKLAGLKDEPHSGLSAAISPPSTEASYNLSGTVATLIGILLIGFLGHSTVVSALRYEREQIVLTEQFRYELANGSAPVAQIDAEGDIYPIGTPVSFISIPVLGITDSVVVEGTTSRALTSGLGHRRDTVLPGQAGTSVIYGRQNTYGGIFGHLSELKAGDTITTTTGLGESSYTVTAVRWGGEGPATLESGASRLTLVSTIGIPFLPDAIIRVDAVKNEESHPAPVSIMLPGYLMDSETLLGTDDSAYLPLLLLVELAAVFIFVAAWSRRFWGRWATYVVATPALLSIGIGIGENVIILLPNLY
ncbi:MAG: hypothetical protein RIS25_774 [Actinomycetota bacterium]